MQKRKNLYITIPHILQERTMQNNSDSNDTMSLTLLSGKRVTYDSIETIDELARETPDLLASPPVSRKTNSALKQHDDSGSEFSGITTSWIYGKPSKLPLYKETADFLYSGIIGYFVMIGIESSFETSKQSKFLASFLFTCLPYISGRVVNHVASKWLGKEKTNPDDYMIRNRIVGALSTMGLGSIVGSTGLFGKFNLAETLGLGFFGLAAGKAMEVFTEHAIAKTCNKKTV